MSEAPRPSPPPPPVGEMLRTLLELPLNEQAEAYEEILRQLQSRLTASET